ncbi:MAG: chemotaxis protein CheW [Steroidobacteraceae bacterium]
MEPAPQLSLSRFLTFRVDAQLYALRSEDISEVIRVPPLARVPQAPAALLGVANLRGSVLPVASLRELLGKAPAPLGGSARVIVLDIGAPVAVLVDSVETLESPGTEQIHAGQGELSAGGGERLLGAFSFGPGNQVAKILDIKPMLEAAFSGRSVPKRRDRIDAGAPVAHSEATAAAETEALVTFDVAGQEFALPLEVVQEILPAPAAITAVAHSDAVVLGLTSMRGALLPLLSLRALLGFAAGDAANDREKVIVMNLRGARIGLVADRARAIIAADSALVDPVPPVLAARVGGESRIRSVYRGEAGRRLISILSPEQLFREDVMQRLAVSGQAAAKQDGQSGAAAAAESIFLVFRLGEVEFGLPIDTIVEVALVPAQITRVPKTPKFLDGVVNLRGEVLPVIDQRRRFDMSALENKEGRKLVVIRTERHRAGIIVDSVSEVLRTLPDSIEPPPDLTDQISRLVRGVINLPQSDRIVLVLDPTELLTRAEQGLLDKFQAEARKADA